MCLSILCAAGTSSGHKLPWLAVTEHTHNNNGIIAKANERIN